MANMTTYGKLPRVAPCLPSVIFSLRSWARCCFTHAKGTLMRGVWQLQAWTRKIYQNLDFGRDSDQKNI